MGGKKSFKLKACVRTQFGIAFKNFGLRSVYKERERMDNPRIRNDFGGVGDFRETIIEPLTFASSPSFSEAPIDYNVLTDWKQYKQRMFLRRIGAILFTLFVAISVPLSIVFMIMRKSYTAAVVTSGAFSFFATLIGVAEISQHFKTYTRPHLQRCIIRVILMVPLYAIESWLSLVLMGSWAVPYIHTLRETYEAYVLYNFMVFILDWLEQEASYHFTTYTEKLARQPQCPHIWPMGYCMKEWPMGQPFIRSVKIGVINYVTIRPLMGFLTLILIPMDLYTEGDLSPSSGYLWITIINNFSQCWALYCLIMLYHVVYEDAKPIKPLAKFLCVKAVVFFSFWQAIVIAILVKVGAAQSFLSDEAGVAEAAQDYLICFEMFIASIAHTYAFSASEWWEGSDRDMPPRTIWDNFRDLLDFRDVRQDMYKNFEEQQGGRLVDAAGKPVEIVRGLLAGRNKKLSDDSSYGATEAPESVTTNEK